MKGAAWRLKRSCWASAISRVLLDTSFVLPSFGIEVGEEVLECLEPIGAQREKVRVYYSPYSLLEAALVLLKEVKRGSVELKEAAEMMREDYANVVYGIETAETPPEAFSFAIQLYGMGHRDIFDNLLYSTAVVNSMLFLAPNRELIEFVEKEGLLKAVVKPESLRAVLL